MTICHGCLNRQVACIGDRQYQAGGHAVQSNGQTLSSAQFEGGTLLYDIAINICDGVNVSHGHVAAIVRDDEHRGTSIVRTDTICCQAWCRWRRDTGGHICLRGQLVVIRAGQCVGR